MWNCRQDCLRFMDKIGLDFFPQMFADFLRRCSLIFPADVR